jgi:hypothetical protein
VAKLATVFWPEPNYGAPLVPREVDNSRAIRVSLEPPLEIHRRLLAGTKVQTMATRLHSGCWPGAWALVLFHMAGHSMRRMLGLAALILAMASPSWAAPIQYTLTFDASDIASGASGPSGTGSFVYDAVTEIMTSLVWDFGGGFTGGMPDAALSFDETGRVLVERIFANAGDPFASGIALFPFALGVTGHPDVAAAFCWGLASDTCGMANTGTTAGSYLFLDSGSVAPLTYRGRVSAEAVETPVPEPASALLLLMGGSAVWIRRRRA